jgi:uncharacterized protein (UPF0210 family)
MFIHPEEVLETIEMIEVENLDIRTVTLGLSLGDCVHQDPDAFKERIYCKILRVAEGLSSAVEDVQRRYGIPIINKRIALTPISQVAGPYPKESFVEIAHTLDEAASQVGVDFIGGFSALVHKGYTRGERTLISAIPEVLSQTHRVCSSVNVATTKAGINMDAILTMGHTIKEAALKSQDKGGLACAKLVVFANAPEDNPFMAGAFHGVGEGEATINVGISGPGVVRAIVEKYPEVELDELAELIKKTAFKITRVGELVGRKVAKRMGLPFGIVDLSLAPTPTPGDSVAGILEAMGLERCGTHGTTAALALLNDAVKKGGLMASSRVGGLSGAFIPVSEDEGMIEAVKVGALSLSKLEAMTAVCSVGLDMIAVPGDTSEETIAAIIADEMAIGVINDKTTAVRIIPAPGKKEGDVVHFGGLLGYAPVMAVSNFSSSSFVRRGGRIPSPMRSLTN